MPNTRLSIASQLYLLIGIATLALLLVIAAAVTGSGRMVASGERLHARVAAGVEEASRLALLFERQVGLVSRVPAEVDLQHQRSFRAEFEGLSLQIDAARARLEELAPAQAQDDARGLTKSFAELRRQAAIVFSLSSSFVQDKATDALNGPFATAQQQIDASLTMLLKTMRSQAQAEVEALRHVRRTLVVTIAGVSFVALGLVIGVGVFLTGSLSGRLQRITTAMTVISSGAGSGMQIPSTQDRDELGEMARALEVFRRNAEEIARLRPEQEQTLAALESANAQLLVQNVHFDAAVNNMSQALLMFDASGRLLIANRRYYEMYDLSPDVIKPGNTIRELIEERHRGGRFLGDVDAYIENLRVVLARGGTSEKTFELPDGRTIVVVNHPMTGGGWVATHDDITERRRAEERLSEQKLQLDTAMNNMTQGLNMFDAAGRLLVCNERYREMYRLAPDAAQPGCTVRELVDARIAAGSFFSIEPEKYIDDLMAAMAKREPTSVTLELTDGRVIAVLGRPTPAGTGWVTTHEDITEKLHVERERDRNREFLDLIIDNVPAAIFVKQASDRRYVLVNRAGESFWEISRAEMIGKTSHEIFPKDAADRMTARDDQLLQTGQSLFDELQIDTPRGGIRSVVSRRLSIGDESGKSQYLVAVIEDVTERKRADERIAHMAHHDALTDLPNRAAFTEHLTATLERVSAEGGNFAVLSIDLDRFKEVNDLFGHSAGDELLREVSRRLQAVAESAFLARLGGDEFMLISADGPQPSTAEALAERLQGAVVDEIEIEGHQLRIGLSIGVAIFPNDGADAATILSNADAGLYRAKSQGRGSIRFFEPDMDQRLRERRMLQHELQAGMRHGELSLHYQPQKRIGGEITGFEALVRWRHPTRGMVPPGTFVPLAEESGLILPMGEWILREACREAASWPRPLHIAVNLSPIQFRHGDLPRLVHAVLLDTGLAANRLELEITEGVLIDDFSRALSILRRLKALGVGIAMDDFGTGYSSLSNLQSFPFDKIKIDQSFILNLESNPQSAAIVRAVLGLGRGLNLPVIAEGVETEAQLAFLAAEGCKDVQGYLIGRPNEIAEYAGPVGRKPEVDALRMRADGAR
jgi:diguanylate cyclase (GGDEF)-like protein/PAS domain S-box-containing protein